MAPNNDIVLFHYRFSPYGQRVVWYLALRGIDYTECIQPDRLPRPDLDALNVNYRRSPVMTIGREVFCDTRLILSKLEERFPNSSLAAKTPEQKGIEKLLESWIIDGGIFWRAASCLPPTIPQLRDPEWKRDRTQMTGRSWEPETMAAARKEGLTHIRHAFNMMETTFLADGREYILGTDKPTLADIEAAWPFVWLTSEGLKGALPPHLVSPQLQPKTFSYLARFRNYINDMKNSSSPKPTTLSGSEAISRILSASPSDSGEIDSLDPLELQKGDEVEIWPTDSGFNNKDRGKLFALTPKEVAVTCKTREGQKDINIHYPRANVRIKPVRVGGAKLA